MVRSKALPIDDILTGIGKILTGVIRLVLKNWPDSLAFAIGGVIGWYTANWILGMMMPIAPDTVMTLSGPLFQFVSILIGSLAGLIVKKMVFHR
jgi:hypothetical protein